MPMSPGEMMAQQAEGAAPKAPQSGSENSADVNPVIDAFRTIATFVAAKSESGDPAAPEMQALLAQFVQLLGKQNGAPMDESGMAPPQDQGMSPPPQGGQKPMASGGQGGVNPMMGNMRGKAMSNQVPVI